ncbi:hypothetical protein GIB67_013298 [Kingdonia uniflora]|uniref:GDSL esterase/lipase n=1 Tax=Kingdonia uniflora TaxID=39325 RepID=A0A7J7LQP0_9MAGN|nr:hypothetical protein GIB67_013298 [Kingdonia uniflora]
MRYKTLPCLILILKFQILFANVGAKVPAIIVFGDSSVDAGNNNFIPTLARSNFQPYGRDFEGGIPTGRFSNGRISTDFISEGFGIKSNIPAYLDPTYSIKDFATGVTFASAGTGFDNVTANIASAIPLWKEVEYFKDFQKKLINFQGKNKARTTTRESLYILSLGTNDFLENYYLIPGRSSEFTIEEYQNFLIGLAEKFVLDIYKLGARKILLTGLTAMGCLPLERARNIMSGHACREDYNKLGRDFNVKFHSLMDKLTKEVRGIKLAISDVYGILVDAIENPHLYGKYFHFVFTFEILIHLYDKSLIRISVPIVLNSTLRN